MKPLVLAAALAAAAVGPAACGGERTGQGGRPTVVATTTQAADLARCSATIPPALRKLVTTHDALGGFARRYGMRVIATVIPSRSTQGQASAGETARLVRLIRRERVPAVFAESSVRSDVEQAIARE